MMRMERIQDQLLLLLQRHFGGCATSSLSWRTPKKWAVLRASQFPPRPRGRGTRPPGFCSCPGIRSIRIIRLDPPFLVHPSQKEFSADGN